MTPEGWFDSHLKMHLLPGTASHRRLKAYTQHAKCNQSNLSELVCDKMLERKRKPWFLSQMNLNVHFNEPFIKTDVFH